MNAFIVDVENRPGQMGRVTKVLAERGVNLLVYSLGLGTKGVIVFIAHDEERARSALRDAGIGCREVPVIFVRMEDKPGQAASASRRLAEAGVNIEVWLPVDTDPAKFTYAVGVEKVDAARQALSGHLTTWSYHG